MREPRLKNVKVISKGDKPPFVDRDQFERSSDVHVYNLYDQDWTDLQAEGLSYLSNDVEAEFEQKMLERGELEEQSEEQVEELEQQTDKVNELLTYLEGLGGKAI